MTNAFIFPGQGSQFVGMGKDLMESYEHAKVVFDEIDESLGKNLSKIMFERPEDELNLTANTQPALMAVSMAVVKTVEKHGGVQLADHCTFMAGHSLGEYSALTAAGALTVSDTAKLLKIRGEAMQEAVPVGEGSMVAILGLDLHDLQSILDEIQDLGLCKIANDNCPGQIVISGVKKAAEAAAALATERGAKKAVMLPVSAPFHSTLMNPAAERMREALAEVEIQTPTVPVVSNVTAQGISEPEEIRKLLVDQITGMVRWRESVLWMKDQGVTSMTELGAGKVLCGLARRIDRDIECTPVGTPEQIDTLIEKLNG